MTLDPNATPEDFAQQLTSSGRRRALLLLDKQSGQLRSGADAAALCECVHANRRDFAQHVAVALEVGANTGALFGAFLHRVTRGQGQGGVRHWRYPDVAAFLTDGLRLSRGMGRKSALAGLWWGGGKGIICRQPDAPVTDAAYRHSLYGEYGEFISGLRGAYVTAEDVGTSAEDMRSVHETTRFVTCLPEAMGGSGNPSSATARGVVCAMEAALEAAGLGGIEHKTIAMQGSGNVGSFMIGYLLERGAKRIIATDVQEACARAARERHPDERLELRVVKPTDSSIFAEPCDVFAPNALGGVLHEATIESLRCAVVCGSANNQLLDDERDAARLKARGIVHVPDFVANRMGIVQCANEQYGSVPDDPAIGRHFDRDYVDSIHQVTTRVLQRAMSEGMTSTQAANQLADELSEQPHPLWPGRTEHILQALQEEDWEGR